jgi:hypothetical protein
MIAAHFGGNRPTLVIQRIPGERPVLRKAADRVWAIAIGSIAPSTVI